MTSFGNYAASSFIVAMTFASGVTYCNAGEYGSASRLSASSRCAAFGPDFVAVAGGDTCVRIGGRMRIPAGNAAGLQLDNGWTSGHASTAALRSDGSPATDHLRVPGIRSSDPFH